MDPLESTTAVNSRASRDPVHHNAADMARSCRFSTGHIRSIPIHNDGCTGRHGSAISPWGPRRLTVIPKLLLMWNRRVAGAALDSRLSRETRWEQSSSLPLDPESPTETVLILLIRALFLIHHHQSIFSLQPPALFGPLRPEVIRRQFEG
jgi:hypothetical protein